MIKSLLVGVSGAFDRITSANGVCSDFHFSDHFKDLLFMLAEGSAKEEAVSLRLKAPDQLKMDHVLRLFCQEFTHCITIFFKLFLQTTVLLLFIDM